MTPCEEALEEIKKKKEQQRLNRLINAIAKECGVSRLEAARALLALMGDKE